MSNKFYIPHNFYSCKVYSLICYAITYCSMKNYPLIILLTF